MFEKLAESNMLKTKNPSKVVEGQGRKKRVNFPNDTQVLSMAFHLTPEVSLKGWEHLSFKKKQGLSNIYWSGKTEVCEHRSH